MGQYVGNVEVIKQNKYCLECCNELRDFHVYAKWDGCCDIFNYSNGYTYEDKDIPEDEIDYIHICNLRSFIKFLTEIADKAEQIEGFEWVQHHIKAEF